MNENTKIEKDHAAFDNNERRPRSDSNKSLQDSLLRTCRSDSNKSLHDSFKNLHDSLVRTVTTSIFDKYEIVKHLGDGAMGTVSVVRIKEEKIGGTAFEYETKGPLGLLSWNYVATPCQDRPKQSHSYLYAMKTIKLDRMDSTYIEDIVNEIEILKTLDHPNIIKLYEVYNNKRSIEVKDELFVPPPMEQIYLVLELCTGGDLFKRAPYSEQDAACIIVQILHALRYMHSNHVIYRDLKFENVLFENESHNAQIKIIDFGVSKKFFQGEPDCTSKVIGTFYSMAPEVFKGVYSYQADMWSLGVIAYMLLSTSRPFYSLNKKKMIDEIMKGDAKYDGPGWGSVSERAKDFVRRLLVIDPDQRMTAAAATEHEWIQNMEQLPIEKPNDDILYRIDECLAKYKDTSELKKIALNVIAHRSETSQILELRNIFESLDVHRDGVLSLDEFKMAVQKKQNFTEDELQEIFNSVDLTQKGQIMYNDFIAATLEAQGTIEDDRIAEAFDCIDSDRSGYITKEDLTKVLGPDVSSEEIEKIIMDADCDKTGKISYTKFLQYFRETQKRGVDDTAVESTEFKSQQTSVHKSNEEHKTLRLYVKIPNGSVDEMTKAGNNNNILPSDTRQSDPYMLPGLSTIVNIICDWNHPYW